MPRISVRSCCAALVAGLLLAAVSLPPSQAADHWVTYEPGKDAADKPGYGKHVVLVSGDDEYRSEETLPQLGKILAERHGFRCTVLFAIDPESGAIKPDHQENIPGLETLESADLLVMFLRFRNLPDEQMKHLVDYIESGRPIVALRTSTHAFNIPADRKYAEYSWDRSESQGGFGRQVLGETWISHHGDHGKESTRGILAPEAKEHPILRGIADGDIWGPTDVYGVRLPLPGDSQPLVLGQVLVGMSPDDAPVEGPKNDPMMPIAWTKSYKTKSGKTARTFTTTMGASQDFESEGVRRLLVNACYWATGLEDNIAEKANVALVGEYRATPFGFGSYTKGVSPSAHAQ